MINPRVSDNDAGEITVSLDGRELRGWSYANDGERRQKMLLAREYVEGWYDRWDSRPPRPDATEGREVSGQCIAYQQASTICSNGFFQKAFCAGNVGCFSCGAISEESLPHCLKDELPAHWLTDDGRPRFVAPVSTAGGAVMKKFWCWLRNHPYPWVRICEPDEWPFNSMPPSKCSNCGSQWR